MPQSEIKAMIFNITRSGAQTIARALEAVSRALEAVAIALEAVARVQNPSVKVEYSSY